MKQKVFAFGCTLCHKSFTQLESLGNHVEKFHSQSENKEKVENPTVLKEEKKSRRSSLRKPGKPLNLISDNVNHSDANDLGNKKKSNKHLYRNNQINIKNEQLELSKV